MVYEIFCLFLKTNDLNEWFVRNRLYGCSILEITNLPFNIFQFFNIHCVNYAQCNALSAYYTALYSIITLHSVYALKGPQYNTSPMKWPV